jgi:hypothetical protein
MPTWEKQMITEVEEWRKERLAAGFYIPCRDENAARETQKLLQLHGHKGFVTHFPPYVEVVLYLIDNPKIN